MPTPINPYDLIALGKQAWDQTKQPLSRRGMAGMEDATDQGLLGMLSLPNLVNAVAPVGQYEDGSTGPAWPALLAAPVEAFDRMSKAGMPAINDDDAWRQMAIDSFDVAGGAMTGGLATGLAGGMVDNALGSAGGRVAQAAERQPQGIRAYRGVSLVDDLINGQGKVYSSSSPRVADTYAVGTGDYVQTGIDADGLAIYGRAQNGAAIAPLDLRFTNPLRVDAQGNRWTQIPYNGTSTTTDHLAASAKQLGHDGLIVDNVYDSLSRDVGDPATTFAALQPGTVYSATTGDLLYANAPTGASIPLGLEAQQETDLDPALMEVLRQYGLMPN